MIFVLTGPGGDGKSLLTLSRSNLFRDSHAFLSPSCFSVLEEFRKQGGQVAHMRAVTVQECHGGSELIEDVFGLAAHLAAREVIAYQGGGAHQRLVAQRRAGEHTRMVCAAAARRAAESAAIENTA